MTKINRVRISNIDSLDIKELDDMFKRNKIPIRYEDLIMLFKIID